MDPEVEAPFPKPLRSVIRLSFRWQRVERGEGAAVPEGGGEGADVVVGDGDGGGVEVEVDF
jgi:hypothetical protein